MSSDNNQEQEDLQALLTELSTAIDENDDYAFEQLVATKRINVNSLRDEDHGGLSPLMEAVIKKDSLNIAKYLITEAKADVNLMNADNDLCPLSMAISCGNPEGVKLLVENGAKLKNGLFDAIIAAAVHSDMLAYIISKGGDVNARDPQFGKTPALMSVLCSTEENLECLKMLKQAGADFYTTDKAGKNLFHLLASKSDAEIVVKTANCLMEIGVLDGDEDVIAKVRTLVNARDKSQMGFTPLHEAVSVMNVAAVELFVRQFKADTTIKTLACDGNGDREMSCADILDAAQRETEEGDDDESDVEEAMEEINKIRAILGIESDDVSKDDE